MHTHHHICITLLALLASATRAKPLVVGTRVRLLDPHKTGTIMTRTRYRRSDGTFTVLFQVEFDDGTKHTHTADELELLPRDEEYKAIMLTPGPWDIITSNDEWGVTDVLKMINMYFDREEHFLNEDIYKIGERVEVHITLKDLKWFPKEGMWCPATFKGADPKGERDCGVEYPDSSVGFRPYKGLRYERVQLTNWEDRNKRLCDLLGNLLSTIFKKVSKRKDNLLWCMTHFGDWCMTHFGMSTQEYLGFYMVKTTDRSPKYVYSQRFNALRKLLKHIVNTARELLTAKTYFTDQLTTRIKGNGAEIPEKFIADRVAKAMPVFAENSLRSTKEEFWEAAVDKGIIDDFIRGWEPTYKQRKTEWTKLVAVVDETITDYDAKIKFLKSVNMGPEQFHKHNPKAISLLRASIANDVVQFMKKWTLMQIVELETESESPESESSDQSPEAIQEDEERVAAVKRFMEEDESEDKLITTSDWASDCHKLPPSEHR